ncbi:MAG TPA: hypothetical protein VIV15_02535 [Anaerolineales bacterium]
MSDSARIPAERSIEELRQALAQREAELAIINSVQAGLASRLDIQSILELVGDKIVEVTGAEIVMINEWDGTEGVRSFPYSREKGMRFTIPDRVFTPLEKHIFTELHAGRTILWNEGMRERIEASATSKVSLGKCHYRF